MEFDDSLKIEDFEFVRDEINEFILSDNMSLVDKFYAILGEMFYKYFQTFQHSSLEEYEVYKENMVQYLAIDRINKLIKLGKVIHILYLSTNTIDEHRIGFIVDNLLRRFKDWNSIYKKFSYHAFFEYYLNDLEMIEKPSNYVENNRFIKIKKLLINLTKINDIDIENIFSLIGKDEILVLPYRSVIQILVKKDGDYFLIDSVKTARKIFNVTEVN